MAGKKKQKITPHALLELKMPGEPRVAPDNTRIAFSVQETDWEDNRIAQHLYVTRIGEEDEVRQLTRGIDSETSPRWSPDGKWLAFFTTRESDDADDDVLDADDEPKTQVWLLPMDGLGGEAEKLTEAAEGVGAYDWLPDSSGIIYLAREPRPKPLQAAWDDKQERHDDAVLEREEIFREQIWRIGREDKKAKLIHPGDPGIGELAISPDGKVVAYTTNYTGEVNDYHKADLWTVEIATGNLTQLTDGAGGKYHPVWSPNGEAVLYLRPLDPELSYSQENLFSVSTIDGESVNLTADFPHDLTGWHGVWFDASGTLFVSVALGTTTAIFRRVSDAFEPVIQDDEHIHDFHVAPNGGIAYVASSPEEAPELLWLAQGADEPVALSVFNDEWIEKYALADVQCVSWQSPDGLEIEGLLTYPIGYEAEETYPLLLHLHGGPHGRVVQSLTSGSSAQVYAAEGYVVLSPNYRGSEGYGDAFSTASRGDLGGGDYRDVIAGVDQAVAQGVADPNRLGVMGSSYGGYLTNWIISHTARFAAAISKFGIFSLTTDFSNSQAPRWEVEYLGGYPWENPERYAQQSPATFVTNIQTPVLILHGEGDANTFIANSQEMYNALRLQKKTVQYVHYPREGHGFSEPEHRLDEMRRCLRWFDTHLRGGGQQATYRIGDKIIRDGWELTVVSASLATYAGRTETNRRYVEVALTLRDVGETRAPLTMTPGDFSLTRRAASSGRPIRPVGLPVDVLGQKSLAEGTGWKFSFAPGPDERGLAVPLAVTFRIGNAGDTYAFAVKDFPPITMDVPAAGEKDEAATGKPAA